MQNTINVAQAFGLVGEIYDLTPFRVDAYEAAAAVTIGGVAGTNANGAVGPMGSTYTTFKGIFVRPHEAVNYGTGGEALVASLAQPAGATVQVMSMGRCVVEIPASATWANGADLYVTSAGALTTTGTNNTLIGKVIVGGASAATGTKEVAVIQLG